MKAFVVFTALVAAASAVQIQNGLVLGYNTPYVYNTQLGYSSPLIAQQQIVTPLATKTQYHAQDQLGQAAWGYAYPGQAAEAVRDVAGNVRGSYSYVNPLGKEVRVAYTAGQNGVQVASNDLPVAPVANTHLPVVSNIVAPKQVQETPEVAQARALHAIAHQEALLRSGRNKRDLTSVLPVSTLGYSTLGQSNIISTPVSTLGYSNIVNGVNTLGYSNIVNPLNTYNTVGYTNLVNGVNTFGYSNIVNPINSYNTVGYTNLVNNQAIAYSTPVVSNIVSQPLKEATLTKVVNTPGHAISYRVD